MQLNLSSQLLRENTELAWRPAWQSLLANGTVNNPEGNNLTGIVYGQAYSGLRVALCDTEDRRDFIYVGDYFFVKAGNDLLSMGLASC